MPIKKRVNKVNRLINEDIRFSKIDPAYSKAWTLFALDEKNILICKVDGNLNNFAKYITFVNKLYKLY